MATIVISVVMDGVLRMVGEKEQEKKQKKKIVAKALKP